MLTFFILLTIGFIFELGKNALTISSRQYISNMFVYASDISGIITDIISLLPQFANSISDYHNIVSGSGINVFSDRVGNIGIEFPTSMSDTLAEFYQRRIRTIDGIINHHSGTIRDLIREGARIETGITKQDPSYIPQIKKLMWEYKSIRELYPHLPKPKH